jgi:hypothetical protein
LIACAALRFAASAADARSTSEERSRLAALRALPLVVPAFAWIALGHVTLPVPQDDPAVSHVAFAMRATAVFFAEIGADPPDLHLGTSLLGAYGWLDRHLPEAVVRTQQALAWAGVALVAYLAARNQRRPLRVVVAGMAPFAVIAVTVFVTALGAHARGATLLGRYLLPAHAFMVVGGGLALARLAAAADGTPRRGLVLSAVALLGTFQLALAAFLITRYV